MSDFKEIKAIPIILNEPVFHQAFKTAEIANLSKEDYKKYLDSLDAYREIKGVTENVVEEGMNLKAIEVVKKSIKKGFSNELIKELTDLPLKKIEEIRNEINNETNIE